ncbi:hypothetical protein JOQ06_012557 [Pogonophryne albipinna]|uniref:PB1 domain-containing protein n=1 Tax=Pogonophryne albipinna TaxID=1090488 RepID=A0AAD6BFJ1_9TELE|nr:hypothetical protein JOQ06_012557 [Pogonophryne albipinna]
MEETNVRLRIHIDHEVRKMTLDDGIPSTLEELICAVKDAYSITTNISLQYKDNDFDDFFTLTSTEGLKDKDTLKVVHLSVPDCIMLTLVPQEGTPDTSNLSSVCDSHAVSSEDTGILSPSPSERRLPWPTVFSIPTFSHNTELALRQGNEMYSREGTPLTSPKLTHDILEHLAEAIFTYTAYPNDAQRSAVAQALIAKHPCLKEPGSYNGCYGWQQSLKYKVGNYRTKRKALGSPELLLERQKTLEAARLALIEASKRKDSAKSINDMMSKTYSWRRQELVAKSPQVEDFKERWPALFQPFQINEEFQRCNAVPLESTFMFQLDRYTPKLLELFNAKGGAVGQRIKALLNALIQVS